MKKFFILLFFVNYSLFSQKITDYNLTSEGYVTAWLLAGPYSLNQNNTRDFDFLSALGGENTIFSPNKILSELKNKDRSVSIWQPINPNSYIINFLDYFTKASQKVCYALTFIYSETTQPITIKCGSDDGIKIILNGKEIHNNNTWRGITPDEDKINTNLNKGINTLLVKVNNGDGGFGFCLKLLSRNEKPLHNINIKIPNNFREDEIFKSIFSSINIYTLYERIDEESKLITNIISESNLPTDFTKSLTIKLQLMDFTGNIIQEFYSKKIDKLSEINQQNIVLKPKISSGRYSIKLIVLDESNNLLIEKDNIVFWI